MVQIMLIGTLPRLMLLCQVFEVNMYVGHVVVACFLSFLGVFLPRWQALERIWVPGYSTARLRRAQDQSRSHRAQGLRPTVAVDEDAWGQLGLVHSQGDDHKPEKSRDEKRKKDGTGPFKAMLKRPKHSPCVFPCVSSLCSFVVLVMLVSGSPPC